MATSKTASRSGKPQPAAAGFANRNAAGTVLESRSPKKDGALEITLPPKMLKALAEQASEVVAVVTAYGETLEQSRKSGQASSFTVEVDEHGHQTISLNIVGRPADEPESERLERALDAARARGRARTSEILKGEEMLSAEAFGELIGVTRVTVNSRRQKHELLGLDAAKRGYRFPDWQLDQNGKPFAALPKLFEVLGDEPWMVFRFLVQRHAALGGVTAKDALRRGHSEAVIGVAEGLAQGDFA